MSSAAPQQSVDSGGKSGRMHPSRQQFAAIVDRINDGFYAVDRDWHITYVNQRAREFWDREGEALVGKHIWDEFPEAVGTFPYDQHLRALREQRSLHFETISPVLDRWIEVSIYPDENGLSVYFRDISERKQAQEALRESKRRYHRLFEEAKMPIALTSAQGRLVEVNPAFCELLGYDREEMIGREVRSLHVDASAPEKIMQTIKDRGAVEDREVRLRRKDGTVIICELSSSPRRDSDGEIEMYQTFLHDVTDRKRAKEALQESERKFRQLAEQSLLGIGLLQDGRFKYVNPRAVELIGREVEEIIEELAMEEIVCVDDWPRVEQYLQRCRRAENAGGQQCRLRARDDEAAHVELFCSPITSEGRPALLCYLLDVTERRRLERKLLRVQEQERRELGRELHDSVASQLTGVAMIMGSYANRADEDDSPVTGKELRRLKGMVREAGEQARQLSHGLHPGRLDGGNLPEALEELAAGMDLTFEGSCRFEGPPAMPSLEKETAMHLYRMAQEAVTNAIKHGAAGRIDIVLERAGEGLRLLVRDDGTGFVPSDGAEGVGLESMRYRARMIGGELAIESGPGEGTTIHCRI